MPEIRKPPRRAAPAFARYATLVATELREGADVAVEEPAAAADGDGEGGADQAAPSPVEQAVRRAVVAAAPPRRPSHGEPRAATGGPYGRSGLEPARRTVDRRC